MSDDARSRKTAAKDAQGSYDLDRFLSAQDSSWGADYETALAEVRAGCKWSHWIWYVFPQLKGLGRSRMATFYGIDGIDEARAYLSHPVLSQRLEEISHALLELRGLDAYTIFGPIDCVKVRSCMTLFSAVAGPDSIFQQVIDAYYEGQPDKLTLELLDRG